MKKLLNFYRQVTIGLNHLQSPMLLAVRLYWGFQFAQTGWGKLHNLGKDHGLLRQPQYSFPSLQRPFVSTLEFVGGILLMLGLFSRPIAFAARGQHAGRLLDG